MPKLERGSGIGKLFYKVLVSFDDYSHRCVEDGITGDPGKMGEYASDAVGELMKHGSMTENNIAAFEKNSGFSGHPGFAEYVSALKKYPGKF